MTDTTTSAPAPTGDVPASPPAAAPEGAPPAPTGAPDPLADLPSDQAVFDRGYVEKVRNEAQRYRTEARNAADQLKGYEDVFGVYDPEDRKVWMDLASTWASDPNRAAQVMAQIAETVLGESKGEPTTTPATEDVGSPLLDEVVEGLTPDKVKALVEESLNARDQARLEQQAIAEVFKEVRDAGFDPDTAEGFMVLYNANHHTGGDIAKAIEMTQTYRQTIIDDYVAGRSGQRAMPAPAGGVVATPNGEPIKNIEDARRATEAFLRERSAAR